MELCGGTHVARTGEIGLLKVVGEGASSAGVRRVEALTGAAAFDYLEEQERALSEVATALRTRPAEAPGRVRALLDERKALQAELAELKRKVALGGGAGPAAEPEAKEVGGVKFLAQTLSGVSPKDLRGLIDAHKARLGSGAILLVAESEGKAAVAAGVTEDLTGRISAVDLVRAAVAELGGKGGGGRPDMAQGGGPDASKAAEAVRAAEALLEG
jgi:alanyl-tRNA synthetase